MMTTPERQAVYKAIYQRRDGIREIANNEHISVNQLVMTAIAEKVSALATEKHLDAMAVNDKGLC